MSDKHFTDAELAAEVWLAYTGLWYGRGKRAREWRAHFQRFATLPHALEGGAHEPDES